MNPDNKELREQLEVRIVAMLLGEASAFEQDELARLMANDPELAAFHDQMKDTIGLTQEASVKKPVSQPVSQPKLSEDRRKVLLAHFQQPKEKVVPLPETPERKITERERKQMSVSRWVIWAGVAACVVVMAGMLLPSLARS